MKLVINYGAGRRSRGQGCFQDVGRLGRVDGNASGQEVEVPGQNVVLRGVAEDGSDRIQGDVSWISKMSAALSSAPSA